MASAFAVAQRAYGKPFSRRRACDCRIDGLGALGPEALPAAQLKQDDGMIASESSPPASLMLVHGAGSGPWVYDPLE